MAVQVRTCNPWLMFSTGKAKRCSVKGAGKRKPSICLLLKCKYSWIINYEHARILARSKLWKKKEKPNLKLPNWLEMPSSLPNKCLSLFFLWLICWLCKCSGIIVPLHPDDSCSNQDITSKETLKEKSWK